MRNASLAALAAVLLVGCVSKPRPAAEAIRGDWQFACVNKTHSRFGQMPPPRFDRIAFTPPNVVSLTSTLTNQTFNGTYTLSGDRFSYEFIAPGIDHTIVHDLTLSLDDDDKALLLTQDQTQMVYYRPDRFLPNDLAGDWTLGTGRKAETMRLGKDGSYELLRGKTRGYYSIWTSPYGKTMTTVFSVPKHGGSLMLWKCDLYDDDLVLTPITWSGLKKHEAVNWTQKKPGKKRSR